MSIEGDQNTSPDDAMRLQVAAKAGNEHALQLLLQRGADPDRRGPDGITALELVASLGHWNAARVLLDQPGRRAIRPDRLRAALRDALAAGAFQVVPPLAALTSEDVSSVDASADSTLHYELELLQQLLEDGNRHVDRLVAGPTPEEARNDKVLATEIVDAEVRERGDLVSSEEREVMIAVTAHLLPVDRALRHGRTNVTIRNESCNAIDRPALRARYQLAALAQTLVSALRPSRSCPPRMFTLRQAAIDLLLGTGNCGVRNVLSELTLAIALRQFGIDNSFVGKRLGHPRTADGKPRDHALSLLTFTGKQGGSFQLLLDPWADRHRVMPRRHSMFVGAKQEGSFQDATADDILQIKDTMNALAKFIPTLGTDEAFCEKLGANLDPLMDVLDRRETWDVLSSALSNAPIDLRKNTGRSTGTTASRRLTLSSPLRHPLLPMLQRWSNVDARR